MYLLYHWTSIYKLIVGKKLKDIRNLELKQKCLYRYNCPSFCTVREMLCSKMSRLLFFVKENLFNRQLFEKINLANVKLCLNFWFAPRIVIFVISWKKVDENWFSFELFLLYQLIVNLVETWPSDKFLFNKHRRCFEIV